jgi:hypothetical protein
MTCSPACRQKLYRQRRVTDHKTPRLTVMLMCNALGTENAVATDFSNRVSN